MGKENTKEANMDLGLTMYIIIVTYEGKLKPLIIFSTYIWAVKVKTLPN
jgi:hypothetical protein